MAYFQWGDDLAVGNELIDQDHRKLINLVNDLHTATRQGQGRAVVGKILVELLEYTADHFRREESHMERIRYAAVEAHKQEHTEILKKVLALEGQYAGGQVTVAAKVSALLREWLSIHIMQSDKAFANFLDKDAA